jgi:hypothetical protein
MTTFPSFEENLNLREQIARIDKTQAEIQKTQADLAKIKLETRYYPGVLFFQGGLATAALITAIAGAVKLFG